MLCASQHAYHMYHSVSWQWYRSFIEESCFLLSNSSGTKYKANIKVDNYKYFVTHWTSNFLSKLFPLFYSICVPFLPLSQLWVNELGRIGLWFFNSLALFYVKYVFGPVRPTTTSPPMKESLWPWGTED